MKYLDKESGKYASIELMQRDAEKIAEDFGVPTRLVMQQCSITSMNTYLTKEDLEKPFSDVPEKTQFFKHEDKDGNLSGFMAPKLAEELMKHGFQFIAYSQKSIIETYNPEKGIWESNGKERIDAITRKWLGDDAKSNYIKETIDQVRGTNYVDFEDVGPNPYKITVMNGVLDLTDPQNVTFSPIHNSQDFSRSMLPILYNPEATCPLFLKFLSEILDPEDILKIQEWIGYHLLKNYIYRKIMMFIGDGHNGKTTLQNVMIIFLGRKNVSDVSLYNISSRRFRLHELRRKLANISPDLSSDELTRTGPLKQLSGNDPINADIKFFDAVTFYSHAKLTFMCNTMPKSKDRTIAYFGRWLVIKFLKVFIGKNDNKNLINEITTPEELSGILNWTIKGLQRLTKNGTFTNSKTIGEMREILEELEDPITSFIRNALTKNNESKILIEDMYQAHKVYCKDKGFLADPKNSFGKKLINEHQFLQRRIGKRNQQQKYWIGYALKDKKSEPRSIGRQGSMAAIYRKSDDNTIYKKVTDNPTTYTTHTTEDKKPEKKEFSTGSQEGFLYKKIDSDQECELCGEHPVQYQLWDRVHPRHSWDRCEQCFYKIRNEYDGVPWEMEESDDEAD